MKKYKAVLFAPDGGWVTDFESDSKDDVIEQLANRGSSWYFYPFEAIILDKGTITMASQRLVDAYGHLSTLKGKSIRTVSNFLVSYFERLESSDEHTVQELW